VNKQWGVSVFTVALVLVGTMGPQQPPPAMAAECTRSNTNVGLLEKVPEFIGMPIEPGAAGPGSAGPAIANLCDVAAAEFQPSNSYLGGDHYTAVKVFAGTANSGNGQAFIDAFLSGLGADAANGTVQMDGRTVQSFVTSSGDGLAYAAGPTAIIGYVVPSNTIANGLDPAATQESAKAAYTRIIARADGKPLSDKLFPGTGTESYPLGRGRYTTPTDPGWVYFKTDDVKGATPIHCGIAPGGTMAGCDMAPSGNSPAGSNQTVVDGSAPAHYSQSDTKTFTRDVDVLMPGHRLENGAAVCWINYQRPVRCEVGAHSFVLDSQYGTLE
jgi:hypothetical protein